MEKTVWITGASSGIGREFARRYAAMGCRLILTARRADRLTALAEELNDAHGTVCRILPADLADRADCDPPLRAVRSRDWDLKRRRCRKRCGSCHNPARS